MAEVAFNTEDNIKNKQKNCQQFKLKKSKGKHVKYNYTKIKFVFSKFLFISNWLLAHAGSNKHIHNDQYRSHSSVAPD